VQVAELLVQRGLLGEARGQVIGHRS
jgi:hypothetical protein